VIIPGHCVSGTFGAKLLAGAKQAVIDKKEYQVNMKVYNVSFSAHADARGIMNLIRNADPETVLLVHGEKDRMKEFSKVLTVRNYLPANHKTCLVPVTPPPVQLILELGHKFLVKMPNTEIQALSEANFL
jgi:integrator complex subunit 11